MEKHPYKEAKKLVQSICDAANAGKYDTREKFMAMLASNPDIAAQGYNPFGKIFFWNATSFALYGYRETDAFNKNLFDLVVPPELRQLARDSITTAVKTGKTPAPSACDLVRDNGEYVTVFSGHLMFQWDNASSPEFYCIDVEIEPPAP